jgi:photosystem II stability/assembly factor-like uncharacterized protein
MSFLRKSELLVFILFLPTLWFCSLGVSSSIGSLTPLSPGTADTARTPMSILPGAVDYDAASAIAPVTGFSSSISLPEYSPDHRSWIEHMVNEVSEERLLKHICALSGEIPVVLTTGPHTIRTRYSYHPDCLKAAEYIYSQFDSMGVDVRYERYLGVPLRCVEFIGSQGYAAGDAGRIFHTEDGGATWEKQESGTSVDLLKCSMLSPDTCWIAASGAGGKLLKTVNGGDNWTQIDTGVFNPLYGVEFVDSNLGWACGASGIILKTSDGGENWTIQTEGLAFSLQDIEFADSLNGCAVGYWIDPSDPVVCYGIIFRTSNGGETWKSYTGELNIRYCDVCFTDSLNGWVVGSSRGFFGTGLSGGRILYTPDGGLSWQTQVARDSDYFYGVCFADSLKGWAVGAGGLVLHTEDGGEHWNTQRIALRGMGNSLCAVTFTSDTHGWATGGASMLHTTDSGATWLSLNDNLPDIWTNVVATLEGTTDPSAVYIVCGHYDSISNTPMTRAPGADDNASGTSLVLEAARVLKDYGFERTLKFVCFSGEEYGPYGSTYFTEMAYRNRERIEAALNFDMVAWGTPSAYVVGNAASSCLVDYCLDVGESLVPDLPLVGVVNNDWGFSDHVSFWNRGYSSICGIELDNDDNPHWHTTHDVVEHLDMHLAGDITRLAVASLASMAGLASTPLLLATIDLDVAALSSRNRGNYITCYIEFPPDHPVSEIDVSTVKLNGSIPADPDSFSLGDYDGDGIADLMVNFERWRATKRLSRWQMPGGIIELLVTGEMDGFPFEGKDTVGVVAAQGEPRGTTEKLSVAGYDSRDCGLFENYPDPFNPRTLIRYRLPASTHVSLRIFDVSGKLVRNLVDGHRSSGEHVAAWNGENEAGSEVSSGIYFYTIETPDFTETRKMVLLR